MGVTTILAPKLVTKTGEVIIKVLREADSPEAMQAGQREEERHKAYCVKKARQQIVIDEHRKQTGAQPLKPKEPRTWLEQYRINKRAATEGRRTKQPQRHHTTIGLSSEPNTAPVKRPHTRSVKRPHTSLRRTTSTGVEPSSFTPRKDLVENRRLAAAQMERGLDHDVSFSERMKLLIKHKEREAAIQRLQPSWVIEMRALFKAERFKFSVEEQEMLNAILFDPEFCETERDLNTERSVVEKERMEMQRVLISESKAPDMEHTLMELGLTPYSGGVTTLRHLYALQEELAEELGYTVLEDHSIQEFESKPTITETVENVCMKAANFFLTDEVREKQQKHETLYNLTKVIRWMKKKEKEIKARPLNELKQKSQKLTAKIAEELIKICMPIFSNIRKDSRARIK